MLAFMQGGLWTWQAVAHISSPNRPPPCLTCVAASILVSLAAGACGGKQVLGPKARLCRHQHEGRRWSCCIATASGPLLAMAWLHQACSRDAGVTLGAALAASHGVDGPRARRSSEL